MKKIVFLVFYFFYCNYCNCQINYNISVGSNSDPIIAVISVTYQGVDTPWVWVDYGKVTSPVFSFFTNSTQAVKMMPGSENTFNLTNPSNNPSPYGEEYQFRIMVKKTGLAPVVVAQNTFTTDGLPIPAPSVSIVSITPTTTGASVKVKSNGYGFKYTVKIAHTNSPPMPLPTDSVVVSGGGEYTHTFVINSYYTCNLIFTRVIATSVGGSTTIDSSFYTKPASPSVSTINAIATTNKVVVNGVVNTGGECPQATVKVRLRWGYSSSLLTGVGNWITGLVGVVNITDSITSLPENTTIYYRWEGMTSTGTTFYSLVSQITTDQIMSCTIIIPPYPISNINGTNAIFSFKGKTNDPLGVEARVIYSNDPNFFSYFSSSVVIIYGNSFTTYTVPLANLVPNDTNYFKVTWFASDGSQGESSVYATFIPKVGIEEIWMDNVRKSDESIYDIMGRKISREELPNYRGWIVRKGEKYFKNE